MARETKAQRVAREAAEQEQFIQKTISEWPVRFVALVQEYTTLPGFRISAPKEKTPGALRFRTEDTVLGYDTDVTVNVVFNGSCDEIYGMEDAERPIIKYHEKEAEYAQVRSLKLAAASKLNAQELELLNINPALF